MALCRETDYFARLADVARFTVDQIPQEKLTTFARFNPAFKKGGFRLDNIKAIRTRVLGLIESKEAIDEPLRKLLADHSGCARVLALLSTNAILAHTKELEVVFGVEHVLFAALLDEREPIRAEAVHHLSDKPHDGEKEEGEENENREWALERLNELLWPLCQSFGMIRKDVKGPSAGDDFAITKERRELRGKARKLESLEKQLEVAKKKRLEAEERADKLLEEAKTADADAGECRQRAERAEAELERNKREAVRQAEAIIQTRLANEFAGWLGGTRLEQIRMAIPEDLFPFDDLVPRSEAGEKDFNALVSRGRHALAEQAKADSISGVRSVLEKRLSILREMVRECDRSLANALRPSQQLIETRDELEKACRKLREILQVDQDASSPLEEALALQINTATDRQLPEWKHIADKMASIGLLDATRHQGLVECVHRRYAALHLQGKRELRPEDLDDARNILRCGLQGLQGVVLLIDGHNMLYALQSRYMRPQDHKGPPSEAREWLKDDIIQMVAHSPSCRVILAFDGPERSDALVAPNVKLIYSGGVGEHRADRVLVDEARFIVQNGEKVRLLLATNDQDLARNASKLGVWNLSPADLLEHLA